MQRACSQVKTESICSVCVIALCRTTRFWARTAQTASQPQRDGDIPVVVPLLTAVLTAHGGRRCGFYLGNKSRLDPRRQTRLPKPAQRARRCREGHFLPQNPQLGNSFLCYLWIFKLIFTATVSFWSLDGEKTLERRICSFSHCIWNIYYIITRFLS